MEARDVPLLQDAKQVLIHAVAQKQSQLILPIEQARLVGNVKFHSDRLVQSAKKPSTAPRRCAERWHKWRLKGDVEEYRQNYL